MRGWRVLVLAVLLAGPAVAAPKPLVFGADYAPYRLKVTLHFPEAEERKQESRCSAEQVERFRAFFAHYLAGAAEGLVQAHGTTGKLIALDFMVGCSSDGGQTITRYRPDQNWATMFYDPDAKGWQIVG